MQNKAENNTLVVDAGATKSVWTVFNVSGETLFSREFPGINAATASFEDMQDAFRHISEAIRPTGGISRIHYYGAGCATKDICSKVTDTLAIRWPQSRIEVSSDLLGAARALFGNRQGIACIAGTGSNSGLYDGYEINFSVPPLGFILGDEGSGAAMGKRLLNAALKRRLSYNVTRQLQEEMGVELASVIDTVYRQPSPAKYLASFAKFMRENSNEQDVRQLIVEEVDSFFRNNISDYANYGISELGFVGSVAYHFREFFTAAAVREGYNVAQILRSPSESLVNYHKTQRYEGL